MAKNKEQPATFEPKIKNKYTSLEMANQMYKDAWLVKRTLFRKNFPDLTDEQIDKKTNEYFLNLKKDV